MANTFFKSLGESERAYSRTLLHEAIPITGTLVSGTYAEAAGTDTVIRGNNIKTYSHGMFQSVYDYPYASSSANHIFDITYGIAPFVPQTASAGLEGGYTSPNQMFNLVVTGAGLDQANKRVQIYNQMAQQLVGYDSSGKIRIFDRDGNFNDSAVAGISATSQKILDPIFINFSRLLVKDEIKKGSFSFDYGLGSYTMSGSGANFFGGPKQHQIRISDSGAESSYKINSPAGEYGILRVSELTNDVVQHNILSNSSGVANAVGLIYYQAGIAVIDGTRIHNYVNEPDGDNDFGPGELRDKDGILSRTAFETFDSDAWRFPTDGDAGNANLDRLWTTGTINDIADNIRHRICNIAFNNTTELNSTIYFCRANHNEFNYSANPTYLTGSKIRVKGNEYDALPRAYVTTVGMYSADNELLAVAKLSEPLRKDPTNELTLRVRLDY